MRTERTAEEFELTRETTHSGIKQAQQNKGLRRDGLTLNLLKVGITLIGRRTALVYLSLIH